ncbi:MAG: hypothetical protein ACJAWV_004390 [Flammeovirgaceae bacterium]|jgi:hypothetical protein
MIFFYTLCKIVQPLGESFETTPRASLNFYHVLGKIMIIYSYQ